MARRIITGDRVRYTRSTSVIVRGFVERTSYTSVYILNDRTGAIVAAHRNRTKRIK